MKKFLFWVLLTNFLGIYAQQNTPIDSIYRPDPHYLEDQLYFGISYIVLKNLPEYMTQNGFSNSVKFGFIRDIPINEQRNFGFGLGLGLSWDTFYQNLRISKSEQTGETIFQVLTENDSYRSNSFQLKKIDIPFEIRWRGSTPVKFKFWRLYTGLTLSYVYNMSANYVTDNIDITYNGVNIINHWQYGIRMSAGYGTWNFSFYYGLSPLLKKDVKIDNQSIPIKNMNFGFVYYFL